MMPEGENITPQQPNEGAGSIPALGNASISPVSNTLQTRGQFLGLDALRKHAQAKRDQNRSNTGIPNTSNGNLNYLQEFNRGLLRVIPTWVKAPIIAAGLVASFPKDEIMNRRNFFKLGGLISVVSAVLAACGGEPGTQSINLTSSGEIVGNSEDDIDGLALLEKETWNADEFLSYLSWSGIGGVMTYSASEAVFDLAYESPRHSLMRTMWSAANAGENLDYRLAIRAIFDAVDNTSPEANGYIIPNSNIVDPNQFNSLTFKRLSDGRTPTSWTDAEFAVATTGPVTDPNFGGYTTEYIPSDQIVSGIDLNTGKIEFLGETRTSKQIAIKYTYPDNITTVDLMVNRNVMFPQFSTDRGYKLKTPDGSREVIMTHLEARHPISKMDIDNLVMQLGTENEALYMVRSAADRAPVQLGIKKPDGTLYDVIFRTDDTFLGFIRDGKIDEAVAYIKTQNGSNVLTAYQPYSRINGQSKGVEQLLARERRIHSLRPPTNNSNVVHVLEKINSGEWVYMPESGPIDIRLAAQLGRYTRAHPRFKSIFMEWTKKVKTHRPKISTTLGLVGAAITGVAELAAREGIDVNAVRSRYQAFENYAAQFNPTGSGEIQDPLSGDSYHQQFNIGISAVDSFKDQETGQIVTNRAIQLPPLHGLPSDPFQMLTFLGTAFTETIEAKPLGMFPIVLDPTLNRQILEIANNPFNHLAINPNVMSYLYGCLAGVHKPHENSQSDTRFVFGVPTVPVPYGETPANIGTYLHPDGSIRFCIIDYTVNGGVNPATPDLGTSFQVPVRVTNIRDIVDAYSGSYNDALASLTPQDITNRTRDFIIRYSIMDNNRVQIDVVPYTE